MHEHQWEEDKTVPKTGHGIEYFYKCPCSAMKHVTVKGDKRTVTETGLDNVEIMNCDRVARARGVIKAYAADVGQDDDDGDVATNMSDLLGDLMHLADAHKLDKEEVQSQAYMHYGAEVEGEGPRVS